MTTTRGNGSEDWSQYRRLVLSELEAILKKTERNADRFESLRREIMETLVPELRAEIRAVEAAAQRQVEAVKTASAAQIAAVEAAADKQVSLLKQQAGWKATVWGSLPGFLVAAAYLFYQMLR